jgi:DNA-binding transcriptional MerR regulator
MPLIYRDDKKDKKTKYPVCQIRNQKNTFAYMPYKDREISKMYYTMGEVSAMFDVNQSLIRFYEKEFDVLQPKKNKKGNRYFTPEDIENFKIIFHLIRDKGYTLNGAKDHLRNNMGDSKENQRVIDSLENIKKFLLEVRDQL